jgi:type I restriction enzyme S subunit
VRDIASSDRNALVGGPFGSDLVSKDYVPAGVPVIRGANMGKGRWVSGDFVFVSQEKADSLSSNCAKAGDLVFTQRGTIGQIAVVPNTEAERYLISQSQMKLTVDPIKADALFLFYVFSGKEQQDYIQLNAIRTGVPHTNLSILRNTPVKLPSLAEQKTIAGILSALDSKIELNHRINGELEGMAKLLYNYWFVQYDFPLSAAQAAALGKPHLTGKPYRTSGGPMVYDTQLKREIPQGWEVGDLEELCSMVRGVTYSKEDIRTPTDTNTISILRATNVNNGIVDLSDLVYVTEDMPSEDQYLEKFDILVVMSSGSKAHVGKNALYCYDQKVAYGAFCSKVVPNPSSRFFVAVHMQSDPFKKYISNVCRGTSINNLTNVHITKHQLPIPPKDQLQEFEKTVSSFFETIACNHQQNQELTTLRDWLLPMLMNGQVRVGDI